MSLVNDLLIELDRQKTEEAHARSGFLDGLRPDPRRAERKARTGTMLTLVATTVFIGAGLTFVRTEIDRPVPKRSGVSAAPPPATVQVSDALAEDLIGPTLLPAPAEPPQSTPAVASEPPPAFDSKAHRIERTTRLASVGLERLARFTRLRFDGDVGLRAVVDQSVSGRRLVVQLPNARLEAVLDGLDLDRTPIVAFTTRDDADGVSFELELDGAVRVRTQEQRSADVAVILIDLSPAPPDTEARFDARGANPLASTPASGRAALAAIETAPAIERSASDLRRLDRERARTRADESIELARVARIEGRLEDADDHTKRALAEAPDHVEAIVARANHLVGTDRPDAAIELVRDARREARRDATLAMLHARLLESNGRRDDAIRELDLAIGAGVELSRAPELHALAAVYLQRAADHAAAIERFEAIVRRHPSEARWWMGLGISLEAMARTSEAVDVYRIAIQLGALSRSSKAWVGARIDALENGEG